MKNYKKELRELRNKMLYQGGTPLFEFGCEVEVFDKNFNEQVFEELVWTMVVIEDNYLILKPFNTSDIDCGLERVHIRFINKILGKPVSLQDILLMIEKKKITNDKMLNLILDFDLTKTPEKQSSKVIKGIINLIK